MSAGKWFVVYTNPRWEKKVTASLTKKNIQTYCPVNTITRHWSDRKKALTEPLFTSYVFVSATESEYATILHTTGVVNFVYWHGKPAEIREEEIVSIKRVLNEYQEVRLEKTQVNLSEQVTVVNDPLMLRKGNLLEVRNNAVKVLLPSLGYSLLAEAGSRSETAEGRSYVSGSQVIG